MKKIYSPFLVIISLLSLCLSSCGYRSPQNIWEDTKTAGRHMGRGLRALGGKQGDSRLLRQLHDFNGPEEEEFISLRDENQKAGVHFEENESFSLSKENPGELGSFLPSIDFFMDPDGSIAKVFEKVYFDTNKHTILGSDNISKLDQIAKFLQDHPDYYIYVAGHCDTRGTANYNMALGSRRSNMVRNELIKRGVNLDRVFTISYGKERPIAMEQTTHDWELNRRAEFKIHKVR